MADTMDTYRTITPYLVVTDADAEMRFMKAAFGANEASCQRGPDQTVMHAELKVGDSLDHARPGGRRLETTPGGPACLGS